MGFFRKILGDKGERIACKELKKKGYKILEKNYRIKLGEIDIIAQDGDTLVFVEVKTRSSDEYGTPAEAVDKHKQKRIRQVAASFLLKHKYKDTECRFDVVCINMQHANKITTEIMQNVF